MIVMWMLIRFVDHITITIYTDPWKKQWVNRSVLSSYNAMTYLKIRELKQKIDSMLIPRPRRTNEWHPLLTYRANFELRGGGSGRRRGRTSSLWECRGRCSRGCRRSDGNKARWIWPLVVGRGTPAGTLNATWTCLLKKMGTYRQNQGSGLRDLRRPLEGVIFGDLNEFVGHYGLNFFVAEKKGWLSFSVSGLQMDSETKYEIYILNYKCCHVYFILLAS